jgi:uncharacterized damage-inducible protein DinB
MNVTLHEMFRYHTWATLTLLDYCAGLPPERLEDTTPGTMGTIHETLAHIVSSNGGYLARVTGDPSRRIKDADNLPLAELRQHFTEQSKGWESVLERIDEFDPTIEPQYDYPRVPHARDLLIGQTLHHGNDHRTHICSILGAKGLEVPEIDVWMYWIAVEH